MRSEMEMLDLILATAEADERIRAVYMNEHRPRLQVKKDIFQDYHIVYVVTDTESFFQDKGWINFLGEISYMQLPDQVESQIGIKCDLDENYGYLVQLADGNRIDLRLQSLNFACKEIIKNRITNILLDKDDNLPKVTKSKDEIFWVKPPTQAEFNYCCNEFWWVLNNVGKELWREEVPYAMEILNNSLRPQLIKMLTWYVGITTNYSCSVGENGEYLKDYLPESIWREFLLTYPSGEVKVIWNAVFRMCKLYQELAHLVQDHQDLHYDIKEEYNSVHFLRMVYDLPKETVEVG